MNLPTTCCQPRGGSKCQPANTDVAGHHALAGEHLEYPENVLALAETIKEDAHRADVQRMRSQPYQMAVQARKLGHHHAHPLRPRRDFDIADQFFHRQRVDQIVREVGQIIYAIRQRHNLLPGFYLALFFDPGMQESDIRNGRNNGLAVQFQNYAQHAVRGRVLRTHVQGHPLAAASGRRASGLFRIQRGNRARI